MDLELGKLSRYTWAADYGKSEMEGAQVETMSTFVLARSTRAQSHGETPCCTSVCHKSAEPSVIRNVNQDAALLALQLFLRHYQRG